MKVTDIMHPEDQKAIGALKKIPYLDEICRSVMEIAYERICRSENLGMMAKVDGSFMPKLYHDLEDVAEVIGIKMPELYVYNDPVMNAFTFGETNPFVCVSSGLAEKMTSEECKAILAHECGHILCQHVLYSSMVETLRMIGEEFGGIGSMLTSPIKLAILYWSRRSEFSADRCAAAVVGERTFQVSMLKLTLGLSDVGNDPYRLVKQAREYHAHEKKDLWSKFLQNCRVAFFSHPQNAIRAYEIDRWKKSAAYRRIRQAISSNIYQYGTLS